MRRSLKAFLIDALKTPTLDRDEVPSPMHEPRATFLAEIAWLRPARGRVVVRIHPNVISSRVGLRRNIKCREYCCYAESGRALTPALQTVADIPFQGPVEGRNKADSTALAASFHARISC